VAKRQISLDGQPVSYTVKRSPRARRARLEVSLATGLTVVVPWTYDVDRLPDLLKAKSRWILGKMRRYGQAPAQSAGSEFRNGDTVPYLGRDLELVVRETQRNVHSIKLEGSRLIVSMGAGGGRQALLLEAWYRMQAARVIGKKAEELSARLGVTYGRITIRGQKTRWGSCSQKGNLNFNWKLIMSPEPVVDYVIIHELAHLKELNHTKRFWQLVAQHCPGWREHRKWLKDNAPRLGAMMTS